MHLFGGVRPEDVRLAEVDGVRTVWAETPGPFVGGLLVRVGHADETLATHGLTHMLEHLALFGLGRPGEHSNGQVDATTLAVHSTGSPAEVAQFLTRAARQLANPPVGRLEDEKGVLRAEAARRTPFVLSEIMTWRWGVQTYGLEIASEMGLAAMTAEAVQRWAATRVGRRNAVLWFTGPPPAGIRIDLPDGQDRPPPDPHSSPLVLHPAYFTSAAPIVAVHGLVRRSAPANALATVLRARLVDELRTSRAAAYSPDAGYRPLTDEVASVVSVTDFVDGRQGEVAERVLATLDELVRRFPTEEELAAHRAEVRRSLETPGFTAGLVTSNAWDLLHGGRIRSIEEVLDDLDRVTPPEVSAAATELWGTALAQVPGGIPLPSQPWVPAPVSTSPPVQGGRTFHALGEDARLVVADEGVTLLGGASSLTVRQHALAALGWWDDGRRVLIGTDGVQLVVEPTLWRRGRRAVGLIDALAPDEVLVPFGDRPADHVPRPPSKAARLRRRLARPMLFTGLFMLGLVVPVTVVAVLVAMDRGRMIPGALGVALILTLFVDRERRRGRS